MNLIGYLRVSTARQGESGLGLEAQRAAVEQYAQRNGAAVLAWYTEVESGKRSDRPELARALAHARRSKATLCVAKLDRLSRNVAFLSALMESKAALVFCDNPFATDLTLHILAAVAQNEAKAISERTKAALAAYKARGGKLGSARKGAFCLTAIERAMSSKAAAIVNREAAQEAYTDLRPVVQEWRSAGLSLRQIAARLTAEGHSTRRGKPWNQVQVMRVLNNFA